MSIRLAIVENTSETTGSVRSIVSALAELRGEVDAVFVGPANSFIRRQGFRQVDMRFVPLGKHRGMIAYPFALARDAGRLAHIVRDEGIDLVHVNDFYNLVGVAARALVPSVPCLYHVRLLASSYLGPIYAPLAWTVLLGSSGVLAVSQAVARDLPRSERVRVVHDGMRVPPTPTPPRPAGDTVSVLYLGHFVPGKGHDLALEAFEQASRRVPGLRLTYVGGTLGRASNAAFRATLQAAAERRGLTGLVTFAGETSDSSAAIAQADIVLNLSESESFSMVTLEAMAGGRPVVASRCGGPEELITPGTGVLVPNRDPSAAAQELVGLALDSDARHAMGLRAHARARREFDTQVTARALLHAYRDALHRT